MKVTLISHTENPLDAICTAICAMHERDPVGKVQSMTEKEKDQMLGEMMKTRLRGALEYATFEFCVEGVTRAFTHQLVRHRKMHFSQQSLRFFDATQSGFSMPRLEKHGPKGEEWKKKIKGCVDTIWGTYAQLVKEGCPTEDARSILPTNVQTLITFGASYRDILEMCEVRLCLQTQSEFRDVARAIKSEIEKKFPVLASHLIITCQRTGICEFKSIFDRYCPIEEQLPKIRERIEKEKNEKKEPKTDV